jgi:hypothetical protein
MKKPTGKLTKRLPMNRETIRALTSIELRYVAGGFDDTGDTNCAKIVVINPPPPGG